MTKNSVKLIFIITYMLLFMSACGTKKISGQGEVVNHSVASMESTAVIDYVVPTQTPNILVDKYGYEISLENTAIIKGKKKPTSFSIVDVNTKEVMYTSELSLLEYDEKSEINTLSIDFSDFLIPGTYYIECEYLGRSENFEIKTNLYKELFDSCIDSFSQKCQSESVDAHVIIDVLTAYEWYPELFKDEDANNIPDVLEVISNYLKNIMSSESYEFTMDEGCVLAKFSFLYQGFDRQLALNALQKATVIYEQKKNTTNTDSTDFFTLVELYRATGNFSYGNKIAELLPYFQNNSSFFEDSKYLYAAMTYMYTRQKVNIELCNIFIDSIKRRAEEVSVRHEDMVAPLSAKNNGVSDVLKRAEDILFSNHILPSYHYNSILAEFLHYLGGMNSDSTDFYYERDKLDFILVYAQLSNANKYK